MNLQVKKLGHCGTLLLMQLGILKVGRQGRLFEDALNEFSEHIWCRSLGCEVLIDPGFEGLWVDLQMLDMWCSACQERPYWARRNFSAAPCLRLKESEIVSVACRLSWADC